MIFLGSTLTIVISSITTLACGKKRITIENVKVKIEKVTSSTVSTPPTKKRDVNYDVTPQESDLHSPIQTDISFVFKRATVVNEQGESSITYTVNVVPFVDGTLTKDLTFIVSGFQTKVENVNAKIQGVTSSTISTPPTKKRDVNYGVEPSRDDFDAPTQADISFGFKRATVVNEQGESSVTYIVNVDPSVDGTLTKDLTFIVSGFQIKTKADAIANVNAKIQGVTSSTISIPPTKKRDVNYGIVPSRDDFDAPTQADISFGFKRATVVNEQGESSVTYTVNVVPFVDGTLTKDLTFIVSGFQTKTKANAIANANAKIQGVTSSTISTPPTKKRDVNYGVEPSRDDFDAPTQADISFGFKGATIVNEQGESSITYTVNVDPSMDGTLTKDLTFIVSGFQTKVENVNAKIQGVTSSTISTPPTKKRDVNYGVEPSRDDFDAPIQVDISFDFKRATIVNKQGESSVTYIVNVDPSMDGTLTKDLTFIVSGFQTKTKADAIANANAKIQGVTSSTISTPPTKKRDVNYGVEPSRDDFDAPTQADISFGFKRATVVNEQGESSVTYIVNVDPSVDGTLTKDLTFTVSGFQTKADANAKIQGVTSSTISTPPTKKRDVNYGVEPSRDDFDAPTQADISFGFKRATVVNEQGESSVTYIVNVDPSVDGTLTKDLTFTVSGFQTKDDANAKIQGVTSSTISTPPTKKRDVNYGIVPSRDDFDAPTQADISFGFKGATIVNEQGESSVTYIVNVDPYVDGTLTKDLTFIVSGFQTKTKADAIANANAKIQGVTSSTISTPPTPNKKIYWHAVPNKQDLNHPTQSGFSFTFKIAIRYNSSGLTRYVTYIVNVDPVIANTIVKEITFQVLFKSKQ